MGERVRGVPEGDGVDEGVGELEGVCERVGRLEGVAEGEPSWRTHAGEEPAENASMVVVKTTLPAASSSWTVSPISRSVQQSPRPHTSIDETAQGAGSVIDTHGEVSVVELCHIFSCVAPVPIPRMPSLISVGTKSFEK